ncbi:MAG: hypothetical protein RBS39_13725 [Phycisphaerales bacterium]|nr:hypothetical protein [Phycisphaerales bacterium]
MWGADLSLYGLPALDQRSPAELIDAALRCDIDPWLQEYAQGLMANDWHDAARHFKAAVAANPSSIRAQGMCAFTYAGHAQWRELEHAASVLQALQPASPRPIIYRMSAVAMGSHDPESRRNLLEQLAVALRTNLPPEDCAAIESLFGLVGELRDSFLSVALDLDGARGTQAMVTAIAQAVPLIARLRDVSGLDRVFPEVPWMDRGMTSNFVRSMMRRDRASTLRMIRSLPPGLAWTEVLFHTLDAFDEVDKAKNYTPLVEVYPRLLDSEAVVNAWGPEMKVVYLMYCVMVERRLAVALDRGELGSESPVSYRDTLRAHAVAHLIELSGMELSGRYFPFYSIDAAVYWNRFDEARAIARAWELAEGESAATLRKRIRIETASGRFGAAFDAAIRLYRLAPDGP